MNGRCCPVLKSECIEFNVSATFTNLHCEFRFGTFIAVAALICAYAEGPVMRLYQRALHAYLSWAGLAS